MSGSQSQFKAMPPIRTGTNESYSSGAMSPSSDDALSPTSTYGRGALSPTSPTETKFFDAISSRLRKGRSRSRSRSGKSRQRSKSPMVIPPTQLPSGSTAQPISPTQEQQRPRQQTRHVSSYSQTAVPTTPAARPPLAPQRRTSSDMWRGRHSNSWLFNDFSVTEATKKALQRKKS